MPDDLQGSQPHANLPQGRSEASHPEPYDPLKLENLARSIEAQMLLMEPARITSVPKMYGAGIYAIYHVGDHELYKPISNDCQTPIYVGKAIYKGGRKGLTGDLKDQKGQFPLWSRIKEHRTSLEQALDLDPESFRVRYLVAVDVFVALAEQLMIRQFRPVWNTLVDGFGNHAPGGGRANQARPPWDELHPGRPWSGKMKKMSNQTADESRALLKARWRESIEGSTDVGDGSETDVLPFPELPDVR